MVITNIKQQVKTSSRYSVFVDGKFAFGLSELGLIQSGITVGQQISPEQLGTFKKDAELDKIYNMALGLLARRPRSKWELETYLGRKVNEKNQVAEILNKLTNAGFVNDLDFARRWVESRRLLKQTSKRKLSLELKQKRIPEHVISQVLADDETDEMQVLKELITKKRVQTRYKDNLKLMQYLTRQGFNYADIKEAMANIS